MADWGYASNNGPSTWAKAFPAAAGQRQSPVDISTKMAARDAGLLQTPLTWRFVPSNCKALLNTGHGWKVDVDPQGSSLVGGPLDGEYQLQQFHCHWGSNSDCGSEHTVDGVNYAGELHLVHWNSTKYNSFGDAACQPDGLAVLGVLLKVGQPHPELDKIVKMVNNIRHKDQKVGVDEDIDPESFLPGERDYWTYEGSLTTPPCNESVTWIVFKQPIEVSEEQLMAFRSLRCYAAGEECPCDELQGLIINNFRPPLPLGSRQLRECGSN